jgi:hypothetical protein
MSPETKLGLRALMFALSQILLLATAAFVYFTDRNWTDFFWGVTIMALMVVRFENRDAQQKLAGRHLDEDGPPEPLDSESVAEIQDKVAKATMQMAEIVAPITESAAGQRSTLLAAGWSETASEQMAVSYYNALISHFRDGQNGF